MADVDLFISRHKKRLPLGWMGASNLGCVTLQFIYIHFPVLCEPSLSATALSQTIFHPDFQLLAQTAHVRFHERKWVHTRLRQQDRTQRLTRRNRGISDEGGITTLGAFRTFANLPGPGIRTANFAAFGPWSGVLPKNAESLRDSDALMRVAVPKASRPRWAAQLYLFIGVFTFVKDLAGCCQYSSPITKGAADSNIRIGTLSGHDQNTPRRSKIQKLNATAA